ncbi:hypothetical protein [Marinomonas sp. PE14-40]|uniref:hypothetical protein n=1 Tax=Marinomonas sp. PE14-40 TaxID=3060621 RepID=UPI003F6766F4
MAVFVNNATYLNYGNKPAGKARAVLWPVLVHRILYPEVAQAKMNLFQKVVMRLVRAKVYDVEDLADLTGFHKNLVLLIFAQLISRGWLSDDAKEITEVGEKAIDEEDEQTEKLVSGYLFQDAVTGKLWPRMENRLALEEPINHGEERPKFVLNRKTGKSINPFKPLFKARRCDAPTSANTLDAWQEYRSDYRAARQLAYSGELPKQVKLSGISYQSEQPESAWVIVWITASNDSNLWSIKDPFGIRDEAWWLANSLPKVLDSNKNLAKKLAELIGQPEPDEQTASEWLTSLKDQAELQVLLDYPWAKNDPDITAALAVLLKRREMLDSGQDHKNDLEAAITEAQKLLEVLMQWLIVSYQADNGALPKSGRNDWGLNERVLEALQIPSFKKEIIRVLARQHLQSVIRCLNSPVSSLKALLFAAALGSIGNTDHPLKSLSDKQLRLNDLLSLADLRNQTSHGNSLHTGKNYKEITIDTAREYINYALQFTEHFKEWINVQEK